ncbi:sensor histidine kinase [Roseivirga sp. BDSF3-8]|uniref:sensor histidine kinase n=1 Tax=Roseivirga sp. BDSF3-8 TaxID=3241598 RepID=UPI003531E4E6
MLLEASNRLRHEVLTKFATELGRATSYEDVRPVLTDNIKYMVNFITARILLEVEEEFVIFQIHRSECQILIGAEHCMEFELETMKSGVPRQLGLDEIQKLGGWENSLFSTGRARHFYLYPQHTQPGHRAMVTLANKSDSAFNEVDHRFLKLMTELLISKVSQLWYLTELNRKNKALNETNLKLDKLYAEVNALNRNLEGEVQSRTMELDQSNRELREIFYRTSHDFRSPITSIRGLMNIARYEATDCPGLLAIFDECDVNTQRMDNMLGKLSKLSDLNDEAKNHPLQQYSLTEVVDTVNTRFSEKIKTAGIDWQQQVADDILTTCMPQSTLVSLISYLVENAIMFRDMTLETPSIRIQAEVQHHTMTFTVADNGTGIPEDMRERIFEMYYRGSEQSKGHGLGLYVVRKLLNACGGEVSLEGGTRKGATFRISLPVRAAEQKHVLAEQM